MPKPRSAGGTEAKLSARARDILTAIAEQDGLPDLIRGPAAQAAGIDDLMVRLRGVAAAIINAEAAAAEAAALAEKLRGQLLDLMQESGAGALMLQHHTVDVIEPQPKLTVVDSTKVPSSVTIQGRVIELWTTPAPPKPKVDLDAVKLARKADPKLVIPGIELSNAAPHIRITSNEKTTKGKAA